MKAAESWAAALAAWAIPAEILARAPESPWGFPPFAFARAAERSVLGPRTPTAIRALEALPEGGVVLDVGSGAGAATLPLAGRAGRIVAVDQSRAMLDEMARIAGPAAARLRLVEGAWPEAAPVAGRADVAVCANVAYNVADLAPFVEALTAAAEVGVVMELTAVHPMTPLNWLWEHFWDLDRPRAPTAEDAASVVFEATGLRPEIQRWEGTGGLGDHTGPEELAWLRRRLCLDSRCDQELAELLGSHPARPAEEMVTMWWPGGGRGGDRGRG